MTTNDLKRELEALETEGVAAVEAAQNTDELEQVRVRFLGRKDGKLTAMMRRMGTLSAEDKPEIGAAANRVKDVLTALLDAKVARADAEAARLAPRDDLSLPGRENWRGAKHPVTLVIDEICDVFRTLGFTRVRGPEAETEWYNFTALNTC